MSRDLSSLLSQQLLPSPSQQLLSGSLSLPVARSPSMMASNPTIRRGIRGGEGTLVDSTPLPPLLPPPPPLRLAVLAAEPECGSLLPPATPTPHPVVVAFSQSSIAESPRGSPTASFQFPARPGRHTPPTAKARAAVLSAATTTTKRTPHPPVPNLADPSLLGPTPLRRRAVHSDRSAVMPHPPLSVTFLEEANQKETDVLLDLTTVGQSMTKFSPSSTPTLSSMPHPPCSPSVQLASLAPRNPPLRQASLLLSASVDDPPSACSLETHHRGVFSPPSLGASSKSTSGYLDSLLSLLSPSKPEPLASVPVPPLGIASTSLASLQHPPLSVNNPMHLSASRNHADSAGHSITNRTPSHTSLRILDIKPYVPDAVLQAAQCDQIREQWKSLFSSLSSQNRFEGEAVTPID